MSGQQLGLDLQAGEVEGEGLPPGWIQASLVDLVGIEANAMTDGPFGSKLKSSHYVDKGVRVIRLGNLGVGEFKDGDKSYIGHEHAATLSRHAVEAGDLLIAALAEPVGRCCQVPASALPAVVKADCVKFRPHPEVEPRFLMHWLNSPRARKNAESHSHGLGRLRINMGAMRRLEVLVSPRVEQKRIVAAIEAQFTRLDDAVATLERVKAKLDRARASVLKAAVEGRLVPTEAALAAAEGRAYEPAAALLERILIEREQAHAAAQVGAKRKKKYKPPAAPEADGLPTLPEGWVWTTVDQISFNVRYGTSAKCSTEDLGVPVLRMGNVVDGRLNYDRLKYLAADHSDFPDQFLSVGELLFNRTNSVELVGKTAVFRGYTRPVACASYLIRVRLNEVYPAFVSHSVNSPRGREWIRSVVTQQVGQANVNGTKLRHHVLPIPPLAEQARIVAEVERRLSVLDAAAASVEANLRRCGRLRQSILERAFEGRLVPQDPRDEPAAALLERIRAARMEPAAT